MDYKIIDIEGVGDVYAKKLTRVVPPLKTVEKMIAAAKELEPKMTY